jgi:hypothetical protein
MFSQSRSARGFGTLFLAVCFLACFPMTAFATNYAFSDSTAPDTTGVDNAYAHPASYDNVKVPKGKTGLVQANGLCAKIANGSPSEIFVPAKTAAEFTAFLNNAHTNIPLVTLSACTAAVSCANPPGTCSATGDCCSGGTVNYCSGTASPKRCCPVGNKASGSSCVACAAYEICGCPPGQMWNGSACTAIAAECRYGPADYISYSVSGGGGPCIRIGGVLQPSYGTAYSRGAWGGTSIFAKTLTVLCSCGVAAPPCPLSWTIDRCVDEPWLVPVTCVPNYFPSNGYIYYRRAIQINTTSQRVYEICRVPQSS